MFKGLIL